MPAKAKDEDNEPVKLTFKPVTGSTRDDFIEVFGGRGGPKYCWCMLWRSTTDELKDNTKASRRQQILGRIDRRVPIGLVGYADGEPVAWVSVAPKPTFAGNLGGPKSEPADKVWSLTCMYMRRAIRGQGLGHQLIEAAIRHASKRGAKVLEAYPVAPDSPSYRHMGFIPAFRTAGFTQVATAGTRRHVLQLTLTRTARGKA
jgi:GNAT superfamily N-acetyltransferase